jgi:hypothetical protein
VAVAEVVLSKAAGLGGTRRSQVPRRRRLLSGSGLSLLAFAALALGAGAASAQTPALDSSTDLLAPSLQGDQNNPPRFRRPNEKLLPQEQTPPPGMFTAPAPSRIGATPIYGSPPAFGAGNTGFDSTNTGRRKKVVRAPSGAAPAQAQPESTFVPVPALSGAPAAANPAPPVAAAPATGAPPDGPQVEPLKAAQRRGAVIAPPPDPLPVSNPPAEVYPAAAATRPGASVPIPPPLLFEPSSSGPPPGAPPLNTLPPGVAALRSLPVAAGDPYAALGLRAGSFLLYPAIELSTGYDTNPAHVPGGPASPQFVVAPELQVRSDWDRHSLTANIVGTYTDYTSDALSPSLNRPYFNSTIDGRIDVLRDTQVLLENRALVSTDNPGSPNLVAGLAKLPIFTTVGGTLGLAQEFNRFQIIVKGTFDRSIYDNSLLTDGESASNGDRDFNQYGGIARFGYELTPGLKPFVEVDADERIHDEPFDRNGLQRDSTGLSGRAGAAIDLFGSLTGEMAFGYMERTYKDPTLPNIGDVIADGALIWQATALTTAKLGAASTVNESIVAGTSGSFSRDVNLQVDHAFLWRLIGTVQAGYGRDQYVGLGRTDNRYFVSTGLTYKLSREVQLKGTVREDWLTSNVSGVAYAATSFLAGVRLQR